MAVARVSNTRSIEHLCDFLPHRADKVHDFFEQVFDSTAQARYGSSQLGRTG